MAIDPIVWEADQEQQSRPAEAVGIKHKPVELQVMVCSIYWLFQPVVLWIACGDVSLDGDTSYESKSSKAPDALQG